MSLFKPYSRGGVIKSDGFFDFVRDEHGKIAETCIVNRTITDEELKTLTELPPNDQCDTNN